MDFIGKKDIPYFLDCEKLVLGLGYKLVDISVFKRHTSWQVKAVLCSSDGVGIDDCSKVHRALLARMEVLLNSQDIYMEVGSPGLNRIIKKTSELYAFIGEEIALWNADATDWQKGKLLEVSSTGISIDNNGKCLVFPYSFVKKIKLMN